jgi:hypothetical protein
MDSTKSAIFDSFFVVLDVMHLMFIRIPELQEPNGRVPWSKDLRMTS